MAFGERSFGARRQGGFAAVCLLLVVAGSVSQAWTREELRREKRALAGVGVERPPLYLPAVEYVKLVTLGFNNFVSDLLWFNTINYFGKQLRGSRDYRWLAHNCDLVTRLDPRKGFVYEFCANMLAWEAKDFDASLTLLHRGVTQFPHAWRYRYMRGFTYWYFLDRRDLAREDLTAASKLPEAPSFLASLAGRLMVDGNDAESAVLFMEEMVNSATDEREREVLGDKLRRAILSRDLRKLKRLVTRFEEERGRPPIHLDELVTAGFLDSIPPEPFGGTYTLDLETREVINTSGERGLEFFGKTKETGIFSMENQSTP